MNSPLLEQLRTDDFSDSIGFILPPGPLRRVLLRSPEVRASGAALREGVLTAAEIREFVNQLLRDYRQGELFQYDLTLAALGVALEHWSHPFAEEYLHDLARIRRPEFPASPRIARECLQARYAFPRTQIRTSRYPAAATTLPASHLREVSCLPVCERREELTRWLRYPEAAHAST